MTVAEGTDFHRYSKGRFDLAIGLNWPNVTAPFLYGTYEIRSDVDVRGSVDDVE